jgi:hypothetical protein
MQGRKPSRVAYGTLPCQPGFGALPHRRVADNAAVTIAKRAGEATEFGERRKSLIAGMPCASAATLVARIVRLRMFATMHRQSPGLAAEAVATRAKADLDKTSARLK